MADPLKRYRDKRDSTKTSEPGVREPEGLGRTRAPKVSKQGSGRTRAPKVSKQGSGRAGAPTLQEPRFVIQKHDASSLHYDFRLEVDGTLRSWAVPKGPSTDPRVKRLAVEVEDHPLEYADFEGVIGEGNYGSGAVIVWDAGTYRNLDEERSMAEMIEAGHVKIWLDGEKLRGGWTLQRTRGGRKPQWLLIKRRDEQADARRNPQSTEPESVKTGRTIETVAQEEREEGERV